MASLLTEPRAAQVVPHCPAVAPSPLSLLHYTNPILIRSPKSRVAPARPREADGGRRCCPLRVSSITWSRRNGDFLGRNLHSPNCSTPACILIIFPATIVDTIVHPPSVFWIVSWKDEGEKKTTTWDFSNRPYFNLSSSGALAVMGSGKMVGVQTSRPVLMTS